jgi:hypothetical protein
MNPRRKIVELEYIPLQPQVQIPGPLLHRLRIWLREELEGYFGRSKKPRERVIRF